MFHESFKFQSKLEWEFTANFAKVVYEHWQGFVNLLTTQSELKDYIM